MARPNEEAGRASTDLTWANQLPSSILNCRDYALPNLTTTGYSVAHCPCGRLGHKLAELVDQPPCNPRSGLAIELPFGSRLPRHLVNVGHDVLPAGSISCSQTDCLCGNHVAFFRPRAITTGRPAQGPACNSTLIWPASRVCDAPRRLIWRVRQYRTTPARARASKGIATAGCIRARHSIGRKHSCKTTRR